MLRRGQRQRSACFNLHVLPNPFAHARLGVTVGKRVSRLAVRRNAIKRLVRETFRNAADSLPPVDIVIVAQPAAASTPRRALRTALTQILTGVQRLSPEQPLQHHR